MKRELFFLVIVSVMSVIPGFGQQEQLVINLSSSLPKNRVFIFENPKGSVKVTGYDGTDIVVDAVCRFPDVSKSGGSGIQSIGHKSPDIYAESDESSVILYNREAGITVDFDIKIPKNFSLKLKSLDNGNIDVINVNGEVVVENANGDISLGYVSGSSVLSSVYGNISAIFRKVDPDSPMMFTSFEGEITLVFPASVNATLKMKTGTGEISNDFNLTPVKNQPAMRNTSNTRIFPPEEWVTGSINSGGPEYMVRSYNGNIIIKKSVN